MPIVLYGAPLAPFQICPQGQQTPIGPKEYRLTLKDNQ
jgi:hypothetical protein